jgi:outer membrane immunogenic protein
MSLLRGYSMIRSILLRAVSIVALISPASAADLYGGGGFKDTPVLIPVWTGFYLGVNGGWGGSSGNNFAVDTFAVPGGTDFRRISGSTDISGGFGGGQLGYNFQTGAFVFGIETDLQGSGISGSRTVTQFVTAPIATRFGRSSENVDWFGTVRGRLGYAFGPALIYGTGGFAYGGTNTAFSFSDSFGNSGRVGASNTETGWTAGGGLEYKFNPAWSFKVEYQFIDLGSISRTGPLVLPVSYDMRGHEDVQFHTIRIGVNYHILPAYEPLK